MRRLLLLLAIAPGCAPELLRVPDATDIGTVGVLVGGERRTLHLAPFDPEAAALPLPEREVDGPFFALYFPSSYVMPSGSFTEDSSLPWSRPLPPPQQVLERGWDDGAWTEVTADALPPFALGVESPLACGARGGCYVDENARACTVPCPQPPEPEPVAPPEGPRYQPCPAGWTDDPELMACRGPQGSCPPGTRRGADDVACRAPGPPSPSNGEPWPVGLDEPRTRFVREGAGAGDGSRDQPWGTVAQALSEAPAGVTLALARGVYPLPPQLSGVARIVGLSAPDTRVVATATVSVVGPLTLGALTVDVPLLRTRGAATIEGALLLGELVVDDGELTLNDVVAQGRLDVRGGGRAVVRESAWVVPTLALNVARGGSASIESSVVSGRVFARGPVTVRDSVLRSVGQTALIAEQAAISLDGVDVDVDGSAVIALVREGASLNGSRVLFGPGQGSIESAAGAQIALEDTVFLGGNSDATSRAVDVIDTALTLRRVRVEGLYAAGFELRGSACQLTVEDYTTTSSQSGTFSVRAGFPIVLRRVEIRGFNVFRMLPPRGAALPWSLDAEDVRFDNGTAHVRGGADARMTRVEGLGGRGVVLVTEAAPDPPSLVLRDLRLRGVGSPDECRMLGSCSASIEVSGPLDLERYHMEGNGGASITLIEPPATTIIRSGVAARQSAAIALLGSREVLWAATIGLRLEDVPSLCDPCGR